MSFHKKIALDIAKAMVLVYFQVVYFQVEHPRMIFKYRTPQCTFYVITTIMHPQSKSKVKKYFPPSNM